MQALHFVFSRGKLGNAGFFILQKQVKDQRNLDRDSLTTYTTYLDFCLPAELHHQFSKGRLLLDFALEGLFTKGPLNGFMGCEKALTKSKKANYKVISLIEPRLNQRLVNKTNLRFEIKRIKTDTKIVWLFVKCVCIFMKLRDKKLQQ